jgi:hypothetical protein
MIDSLWEEYEERIELAVIAVVMTVVYFYVIHPILLDVAPFLAFQSSEGFDRRSGGLGPYSLPATVFVGIFIYYVVIRSVIEDGVMSLFAFNLLILLILIPIDFSQRNTTPKPLLNETSKSGFRALSL